MKLPKRNLISDKKTINKNISYEQNPGRFKPNGLWYSCYNAWFDKIMRNNMNNKMQKYIHKLNLKKNSLTTLDKKDKGKILVINKEEDIKKFTKKYRDKRIKFEKTVLKANNSPKLIIDNSYIDWEKVAKDYGGIEFCPYIPIEYIGDPKTTNYRYQWYNTIDVSSGCIWNIKDILNSSKIIYKKVKNKFEKVVNKTNSK